MKPKPTALLPVFGSNRMNAEHPAKHLTGCEWIGVPFAGGFCEVRHFTARTIVCNDLNRHAINLAEVVAKWAGGLRERLDKVIFCGDRLFESQRYCLDREAGVWQWPINEKIEWAYHYFICAWMARNGTAGTDGEFDAGLSVRWDAGGGDSVVRFRNATDALADWQDVLKRCTFVCSDAFDFLGNCKDAKGHGIYADPPWPKDGEKYKHKFTPAMHEKLADVLGAYKETRVVVRYGDHPLIRQLYPESKWTWHYVTGRTQANSDKAEVLLVNRI